MDDLDRAVAAATAVATAQGLDVAEAVVLHDSNKVTVRLLPADVVARVAHRGQEVAAHEVALARALAGGPVASLVVDAPLERDGFVITLWAHHAHEPVTPAAYADALARLHAAMRSIDVPVPPFSDRVGEAEGVLADPARSPGRADADRALALGILRDRWRAIVDRGAPEQVIHGEPHPGNVLGTATGAVFVDLETCTSGPVEIDLAHVPAAVADRYADVDVDLLEDCRGLVLAMVVAWRWEPDDRFPGGREAEARLLAALRAGPPWPTLDVVMG